MQRLGSNGIHILVWWGKSGIFVVIKFIDDMAIRKYAMVAAMALALMPGGLKAQVTSQDVAAAVGQGVVDF